jgi:hypothetical protein
VIQFSTSECLPDSENLPSPWRSFPGIRDPLAPTLLSFLPGAVVTISCPFPALNEYKKTNKQREREMPSDFEATPSGAGAASP